MGEIANDMGKPEVGIKEDGPGSEGPWTLAPEFELSLRAVGTSNV